MRMSRKRIRKKSSRTIRKYYVLFLVLLPIAALLIGYGIAKLIIIPIFLG